MAPILIFGLLPIGQYGAPAKSTRGRKWILLYSECCKTRGEAMSREWYIKHDRRFRTTLRATIRT